MSVDFAAPALTGVEGSDGALAVDGWAATLAAGLGDAAAAGPVWACETIDTPSNAAAAKLRLVEVVAI